MKFPLNKPTKDAATIANSNLQSFFKKRVENKRKEWVTQEGHQKTGKEMKSINEHAHSLTENIQRQMIVYQGIDNGLTNGIIS